MNTTDTSRTKLTTLSINENLLNELHHRAHGAHPLSYYINRAAEMKMGDEQRAPWLIRKTNTKWWPTKKIQVRLRRIVWEYLEMNCLTKSRFINDALAENLRYIKDPEP